MTERAQALEAALIGAGVLAQEVLASRQNVGNYLRQLAQSVLNDLSTTENIPQPVQRFDLVSVSFAYTSDHEMQRSDDGEWVRFDDVFPPAALSPVEPTVHNDLCSWCLTQADHVAASEECYERNSERGRITTRPPVEPAGASEPSSDDLPELWRQKVYPSIAPDVFQRQLCDLTERGWDDVRREVLALQSIVASRPAPVSPVEPTPPIRGRIERCPDPRCGCRMEHSPDCAVEPTPEPPKCVCSACEPLVDPGQRPSLEDINRLEKAAWDSKTDRVLVWYRDQIGLYQQRIRETERAWQVERKSRLSTPVEPAGASEPPKKWIPTEGCTCYLCRAARLSPAPVSPVAPEPPTETECCREPIAADERFCQKCGHEARIQPAGEPAPCVWREKESGYESRQFDTACGGEVWLRMYQQFNFCPFCGHPLTVER